MSRLTRSQFAELVREHHAAVFATARRILRRDADAEDVTQQVYLRALEQPAALAAAQEPRALLLTMARHLACNWLRDCGRRARQEHLTPMAEPVSDPASAAALADERARLRRHVDALPDELRVPLILRFEENLSFAAVGAALDLAESSAFERVQRGLERLKERLTRAGLAGLAVRVEAALEAPAPIGVPTGLQATLLGLFPAGLLSAGSLAAALVLVAAVGGVAWLGGFGGGAGPEPTLVASTGPGLGATAPGVQGSATPGQEGEAERRRPVAAPQDAPAKAGAAAPAAALLPARLEGSVQEAGRGPLAGWMVSATSHERRGKEPLFRAAARTDANGRFALELPVIDAAGNLYHLSTCKPGDPLAPTYQHATRLLARPGAALPFLDLLLGEEFVPRAGAHELLVTVLDAAGRPVPEATVALRHRPYAGRSPEWTPEAQAVSDGSGRASVRGVRLGTKALCVDARKQGFGLHLQEVAMPEPGRSEQVVRLAPGLSLGGRIRTVNAVPVPRNSGVRVVDETAGEPYDAHASIQADGSFEFKGLAARPHRLELVAEGFSPVRRRNVVPTATPLEFVLKPWDDARDHGDHWGEIHGEVRDAATGKPVDVSVWDVECHWLHPDERPDLRRDFVPDLVHGRSVQKAMSGPLPDPAPRFHRVDLGPGTWMVEVRARGYAPAFVGPIDLVAGELRSGVVVDLRPGAEVRGVVRDGAGRPLAGAVVFLAGQGPRAERKIADQDEAVAESKGRATIYLGGEARTDERGAFTLSSVPAEVPLRVVAVHPRWRPVASVARVFTDREPATVELRCTETR